MTFTRRMMVRLMTLALGLIPMTVAAAGAPAKEKPAAPLASGTAAGTFVYGGKTIRLSHATTFRNDKSVVVLLTDEAVPSAGWKDSGDEMMYRMSGHKFGGVEFYLDDKRQVTQTNYYAGDFPTGARGVFEVKLDSAAAKSITGSIHSTPFAETQLDPHVKLDVRFNAPLR